jgi:hypothetical protein
MTPALAAEIDNAVRDVGARTVASTFSMSKELKGAGMQLGRDVMTGFITGANDMEEIVKNSLINLMMDLVTKYLASALGIASPSKETAWMGRMLMLGFVEGMYAEESRAAQAAVHASGTLVQALESSFLGAVTRAPEFGIADAITVEADRTVGVLEHLAQSVSDAFTNPLAGIEATFSDTGALAGAQAFGHELAMRAAQGVSAGAVSLAHAWAGAIPGGMTRMGMQNPSALPAMKDGLALDIDPGNLPAALTPMEATRDQAWIAFLSQSLVTYKQRGGRFD